MVMSRQQELRLSHRTSTLREALEGLVSEVSQWAASTGDATEAQRANAALARCIETLIPVAEMFAHFSLDPETIAAIETGREALTEK